MAIVALPRIPRLKRGAVVTRVQWQLQEFCNAFLHACIRLVRLAANQCIPPGAILAGSLGKAKI